MCLKAKEFQTNWDVKPLLWRVSYRSPWISLHKGCGTTLKKTETWMKVNSERLVVIVTTVSTTSTPLLKKHHGPVCPLPPPDCVSWIIRARQRGRVKAQEMLSLGRTKRRGSFLNACQAFIIAEMLVYWRQVDNRSTAAQHTLFRAS